MRSAMCDQRPASTGLLGEEGHDDLPSPAGTPEQIVSHGTRPTSAALNDLGGRPSPLDERTLVGCEGASDSTPLEGSLSRHHAQLGRDAATAGGIFRDPVSSTGTSVDDQPVTEPTRLARGARITDVGLATVPLRLHEPSRGGGGTLEVFGKKVQLATTHYELRRVLADRMLADAHQPDLVRGFMRSSELVGTLSWITPDPADTHVKHLVRRTRRVLIKAEIGDLIEARQRFGYRLRVIPKLA